jgi:chorismate mutase
MQPKNYVAQKASISKPENIFTMNNSPSHNIRALLFSFFFFLTFIFPAETLRTVSYLQY